MAKLHELIAAEPNVMGVYQAMREETLKVFDKPDNFLATTAMKNHLDEANKVLDTQETKEMATTVPDRLQYLMNGSFVKYIDLQMQKDRTNQLAQADIVINGAVLVSGVPSTMLLQLEKDLKELRNVFLKAPTLPSGIGWDPDPDRVNTFKTREPQVTFSTKKVMKPVILVPADEHHPAQVDKMTEDVTIAKITRTTWSGMITSRQKADMLGRLDGLLVAVKKARQRANGQEVNKDRIGKTIASFILDGPEDVDTDD